MSYDNRLTCTRREEMSDQDDDPALLAVSDSQAGSETEDGAVRLFVAAMAEVQLLDMAATSPSGRTCHMSGQFMTAE